MNKYEKMIEEIKAEIDTKFANYSNELNQLHDRAEVMCHKYNDQINAINSSRQSLQDEIAALYKFLKRFGNVGKKITPFEYVTEDSRFIGNSNRPTRGNFDRNGDYDSSGFIKTAAVTSIVFAPAVLPAVWTVDAISKRSKNKNELQKLEMDFETQLAEWEQSKEEMRAQAKLYEDATAIANIYRALIATVRMAIKDTILPELTGIDAFLIADAIKDCIISDMDPQDAEIANISEYQGTAYDMHFVFVRNAFDYYTMIVKFFTEPILTNIVADNKVTSAEKKAFEMKVSQIKQQTKLLEDSSVFGGAV